MKKFLILLLLVISCFPLSDAEAMNASTNTFKKGWFSSYSSMLSTFPFYTTETWFDVLPTEESEEEVQVDAEKEEVPILSGKIIVLDAGHGGKDSGANANNLAEKQINLPVTLKTAKLLEDLGAEVHLTRKEDVTITRKERYTLAGEVNADIFISIHANSADPSISGLETFYHHDRDRELADTLHAHVIFETTSKNRGVRYGDYYVLRDNSVPSALIETGFLTNKEESIKLSNDTFQETIAKGIVNGVLDYFN